MFRKNCVFFQNHCNPSLAYIAVKDLQSSQRNASVQSILLAGNFLYNQYQPSAGEGEVANFREFLEKNTIFKGHPVCEGQSKGVREMVFYIDLLDDTS